MDTGTLWAVNTSRASARRAGSIPASAARARSAIASMNRGCSLQGGA